MGKNKRTAAAALAIGIVLGLSVPAAGHVSTSIAHNWSHYKALAQKLFFTKTQSDARYPQKSGVFTKTESDDRFAASDDALSAYCRLVDEFPATYPAGPCRTTDVSITHDPADDVGGAVAMAVGVDGIPVIAAYNNTDDAVDILRCTSPSCLSVTSFTYENGANDDIGNALAMTIGTDGVPVIAARNVNDGAITFIRCTTPACTAATSLDFDTIPEMGSSLAMVLGTDGVPIVAARNETTDAVEIIRCFTSACAGMASVGYDTGDDLGLSVAIAIRADGRPVIAASNSTDSGIELISCESSSCFSPTSITFDPGDSMGLPSAIAVGPDGIPVIAARNETENAVELIRCTTAACTAATSTTFDPGDNIGAVLAIAVGTDGVPVIVGRNISDSAVELIRCTTAACTGATSVTTFKNSANDDIGSALAMALGTDGIPVIAARNTSDLGVEIIRAPSLVP